MDQPSPPSIASTRSDRTVPPARSDEQAAPQVPPSSTDDSPGPKKKGWSPLKDAVDKSEERRREAAGKKNNWFVRKFAVGLVIVAIGWTIYAFVVRVCMKMLQGRVFSVGRGVAFLVIFFLLLAMFTWSYIKILVVGPGQAKDVVKSGLEGRPYETFPPSSILPPPSHDHQQHSAIEMRESQESHSSTLALQSPPDCSSPLPSETHSDPRPHTTLLAQAPGNLVAKSKRSICAPPPLSTQRSEAKGRTEALVKQYGGDGVLERLPGRPEEDGRWCEYCNLPKPLRTHHSSAAGTCVRKFDHFCPWIGQEVGQLNQKFFLIFCGWSTLFTLFILIAVAASVDGLDYDGSVISLLPLSALFTLFTAGLGGSHIWMALHNVTTVEQYRAQNWAEGEGAIVDSTFRFWEFGKKREVRQRWACEWGGVYKEGNRWFVGYRRNWEGVMGMNKWGWFLPVGRPLDDGVSFPVNPRVGDDGGWRKRMYWPKDLQ